MTQVYHRLFFDNNAVSPLKGVELSRGNRLDSKNNNIGAGYRVESEKKVSSRYKLSSRNKCVLCLCTKMNRKQYFRGQFSSESVIIHISVLYAWSFLFLQ